MRGVIVAAIIAAGAGPAAAACAKPEALATLQGKHAFEQTRTLKGIKRPIRSAGEMEALSEMVVWRTTSPVEIVTRIGPGGVTQSIDGGPEERVGPAGGTNPFLSETGLLDLLRGNLSGLDGRYAVKRGTRAKPQGWTLDLKPKSKALAPYIARIAVEGCRAVESITVSQANGDAIRIDLMAAAVASAPK